MKQLKTVKAITTATYGISLVREEEMGYYQIVWSKGSKAGVSEKLHSTELGLMMFDMKVTDLNQGGNSELH